VEDNRKITLILDRERVVDVHNGEVFRRDCSRARRESERHDARQPE
jgi:hypothetical protein